MDALASTLIYIFGLICLGYGVARIGLLREETGEGIADFVFVVAIPVLLFQTMATADFGDVTPIRIWAYFGAIAVAWIVGQMLVSRVFGRDARASVVGGVAASFSNLVLLGIPFMLSVFGKPGFAILSLIVSVHLAVMMAASVLMFEWAQAKDGTQKKAAGFAAIARNLLGKLATNPLLVGIGLGLIVRWLSVPIPEVGWRILDALAQVAGPVALFAIGMGLKRFGLAGNIAPAFAVTLVKVLLMPTVALCLAWLFGLSPLAFKVVVMGACLPPGINPYLIAVRFGTGQALASNASTLGTAVSILTIPVWLLIADHLAG